MNLVKTLTKSSFTDLHSGNFFLLQYQRHFLPLLGRGGAERHAGGRGGHSLAGISPACICICICIRHFVSEFSSVFHLCAILYLYLYLYLYFTCVSFCVLCLYFCLHLCLYLSRQIIIKLILYFVFRSEYVNDKCQFWSR